MQAHMNTGWPKPTWLVAMVNADIHISITYYVLGPSTSGGLEVDTKARKDSQKAEEEEEEPVAPLPRLSEQLLLEELWEMLGECLSELAKTPDHHAVLVLQPAVEAFFLVHAGNVTN